MAYTFLRGDRDQPFLLPPDLRDWLPEGHLAWFILDVVDQVDLAPFYLAHRNDGHGHPAYDPKLLLGVLLYAYCIGVHSSRQIERRLNEDIAWEHTFEHQPLGGWPLLGRMSQRSGVAGHCSHEMGRGLLVSGG